MDAWEAYAVDAAEERGDQPSEDAISNALGSLADSASQWISPEGLDRAVEKAAALAKRLGGNKVKGQVLDIENNTGNGAQPPAAFPPRPPTRTSARVAGRDNEQ